MTHLLQFERDCEDRPLYGRQPWNPPKRELHVVRKACSAEPQKASKAKLTEQFESLARQWKRETATVGHLSKIVMHPAYQRIMAMGPNVIPLILQEMSKESGHWFWALHNLVPNGEDPAEGTTTIKDARRAWLDWGKQHRLL